MQDFDPYTTIPEARDPAALDVWMGSYEQSGAGEYGIHIRNRSTNPRDLHVTARSASAIVSSLAFARDTASEVWRPSFGYEGRVHNWARLSAENPSGTLTRDLPPSEAQDLFVEIAGEPPDSDAVSADLLVEVQMPDRSTQPVATIAGVPMDTTKTDLWTRIGRIPALPEGGTLQLRALLPEGAESARLQLGQVALVSNDRNRFEPVAYSIATIAPMSESTVSVAVSSGAQESNGALLFEVSDPEYRVHRFLVRHERRNAIEAPR